MGHQHERLCDAFGKHSLEAVRPGWLGFRPVAANQLASMENFESRDARKRASDVSDQSAQRLSGGGSSAMSSVGLRLAVHRVRQNLVSQPIFASNSLLRWRDALFRGRR
jgi:hypothetical protein